MEPAERVLQMKLDMMKRYLCVSRLIHPLSYCGDNRTVEMKGLN